jgi:hypothetical protein
MRCSAIRNNNDDISDYIFWYNSIPLPAFYLRKTEAGVRAGYPTCDHIVMDRMARSFRRKALKYLSFMLFLIDEKAVFSIIKLENLCSLLALNGDSTSEYFSGVFPDLYIPEKKI